MEANRLEFKDNEYGQVENYYKFLIKFLCILATKYLRDKLYNNSLLILLFAEKITK